MQLSTYPFKSLQYRPDGNAEEEISFSEKVELSNENKPIVVDGNFDANLFDKAYKKIVDDLLLGS